MELMELEVTYKSGVITGNFDTLKTALNAKLADFKNVVYTEDTVKDGKKDLAELRKLRTALDSKRKEIKKHGTIHTRHLRKRSRNLQHLSTSLSVRYLLSWIRLKNSVLMKRKKRLIRRMLKFLPGWKNMHH